MAKVISVIGLGQVGTAALFALKRFVEHITIQGYDPDPAIRIRAIETGALKNESTNLTTLVQTSDIVLDCSPYTAIKNNLPIIVKALPDTAIYICCAPNKHYLVKAFADAGGRPEQFFGLVVSMNREKWKYLSAKRVLNEPALFSAAMMGISVSQSSPENLIKTALDMLELLGAKCILIDHEEADLIEDRITIHPMLAAYSAVSAAISEPGWGEAEKFAGFGFGRMLDGTGLESVDDLAAILTDAPEGALRWMTARSKADRDLESAIRSGELKTLTKRLSIGAEERAENGVLFEREIELKKEVSPSFVEKIKSWFMGRHG